MTTTRDTAIRGRGGGGGGLCLLLDRYVDFERDDGIFPATEDVLSVGEGDLAIFEEEPKRGPRRCVLPGPSTVGGAVQQKA